MVGLMITSHEIPGAKGVNPEHLAVIHAAVVAACGPNARAVSIREVPARIDPADDDEASSTALGRWVVRGRQVATEAHRVRRVTETG
ncbi:MAG: hypothetical protein SFY95_05225 [Planctomycetota bacterium]|nr:hypothetical protein [Planctomycetota bacterium]